MAHKKDDWQKVRGKGDHFTEADISILRDAYRNKRRSRDVARELGAASRTVSKYFGLFRMEGVPQRPKAVSRPVERKSRFYHSDFKL